MAKYTGSPFGTLRGKLGPSVGGTWKGIKYVREYLKPSRQGTIRKYDLDGTGCTRGINFSFRQFNYSRGIFGLLTHLSRQVHNDLISRVWQTLANKLKLKQTGMNLFVKKNARVLWKGITGNQILSENYLPDFTQMLISDGILEPTRIVSKAEKNIPLAGQPHFVEIDWDTNIFRNGSPNDDAFVAVYHEPTSREIGMFETTGELIVKGSGVTRSAGTAQLPIPSWDYRKLTAFVFFADNCANYSPSISKSVTIAI